jgi:hypothetical protein
VNLYQKLYFKGNIIFENAIDQRSATRPNLFGPKSPLVLAITCRILVRQTHLVKHQKIIGSYSTKTNHHNSKLISSLQFNKLKVFYLIQAIRTKILSSKYSGFDDDGEKQRLRRQKLYHCTVAMKLEETFGAPSKMGGWHDVTRERSCTHS